MLLKNLMVNFREEKCRNDAKPWPILLREMLDFLWFWVTKCCQSFGEAYVEPCPTSIMELFYENIGQGSRHNSSMNVLSECRDSVQVIPWCPVTNLSYNEGVGYSQLRNWKHQLPWSCCYDNFSNSNYSWWYLFLKKRRLDLLKATMM